MLGYVALGKLAAAEISAAASFFLVKYPRCFYNFFLEYPLKIGNSKGENQTKIQVIDLYLLTFDLICDIKVLNR